MLKVKRPLKKPSAAKKVASRSMKTAKTFFTANPNVVARMKTATNVNKLARTMGIMTIPKAIEARGTILSVRGDIMTISLTRKLVRELRDVYLMTVRDQWEYAGAVKMHVDRDYANFNTPTKRTNRLLRGVQFTEQMFQFKLTYHSHPAPRGVRSLATIPSPMDFRLYISNYPDIQANIILDNEGLYVVDIVERATTGFKPNATEAWDQFHSLVERSGAYEYMIDYDALTYRVDKNRWKSFINKTVDPIMRSKYNVSILFYFYDELPQIRIRGQ
jgi:hypothetical protein